MLSARKMKSLARTTNPVVTVWNYLLFERLYRSHAINLLEMHYSQEEVDRADNRLRDCEADAGVHGHSEIRGATRCAYKSSGFVRAPGDPDRGVLADVRPSHETGGSDADDELALEGN